MKLLVAGCGFTGAALLRLAGQRGVDVLGLTLSEESARLLTKETGLPVVAADLSSETALRALGSFDTVVHCASSGRGGPDAYERVFVGGATALRHVFPSAKLVFTSSTSVHAQTDGDWVTEESPAEGGEILQSAESIALNSPRGAVVRLAGLYGPDRCHALKAFLEGRAAIDGHGEGRWMNYIHRDDASSALLHVVTENLSGVHLASDGNPITQADWLNRLRGRFGGPPPECRPPDTGRRRGWSHKRVSPAKLIATGWKPLHPSLWDWVVSEEGKHCAEAWKG